VALVSIGIGKVRRGYERYFSDLFEVLRDRMDITLYVGEGGDGQRVRTPGDLRLPSTIARMVPIRRVAGGSEYRGYDRECLAYALALVPRLMRGEYDIVHAIDYPVARALGRLKRVLPIKAELVFCNACACPAAYYPRADHVQHIAAPLYDEALSSGFDASRLWLAPCGVRTGHFRSAETREMLRSRYGVGMATRVVLAVSAVKRTHKRVDYLIEEFARADIPDALLWIDGSMEDPTLADLARDRLGDRCRITHVDTSEVPGLLGLADVFVHGALEEAFGLAIVEALSAGLPVITHDSPHFRWLAGDAGCFADMQETGSLAHELAALLGGDATALARSGAHAACARERFDWNEVAETYAAMYAAIAGRRA
jgi:glycosyltransferase involved in cell wall biosynthesis